MTKVLIHKTINGILKYAVVTPFGVKPFGADKDTAIRGAKLSSVFHQKLLGDDTEEDYKMCKESYGCKYVGCFFVETVNEQN